MADDFDEESFEARRAAREARRAARASAAYDEDAQEDDAPVATDNTETANATEEPAEVEQEVSAEQEVPAEQEAPVEQEAAPEPETVHDEPATEEAAEPAADSYAADEVSEAPADAEAEPTAAQEEPEQEGHEEAAQEEFEHVDHEEAQQAELEAREQEERLASEAENREASPEAATESAPAEHAQEPEAALTTGSDDFSSTKSEKRASRRFNSSETNSSTTSSTSTTTPSWKKDAPASTTSTRTFGSTGSRAPSSYVPPKSFVPTSASSTPTSNTAPSEAPRLRFKAPAQEVVDGEAAELVKRIVDGDESVSWGLFECAPSVTVFSNGTGTVEDLRKQLTAENALFGYLRVPVGAEQRTKFVFLRWVGDKVSPMTRAKFMNGESVVKKVIKIYHIEVPCHQHDELTVAKIAERLAKAAGANYDKTQNAGPGVEKHTAFNDYKLQSKEFFREKERQGNLKEIQFAKGPMARTTPVDLVGRKMTVGAVDAHRNIVDLETKK